MTYNVVIILVEPHLRLLLLAILAFTIFPRYLPLPLPSLGVCRPGRRASRSRPPLPRRRRRKSWRRNSRSGTRRSPQFPSHVSSDSTSVSGGSLSWGCAGPRLLAQPGQCLVSSLAKSWMSLLDLTMKFWTISTRGAPCFFQWALSLDWRSSLG